MTALLIELTFDTEPPVRKQFTSAESQQSFIDYERKCCVRYYKNLCKAHTPEERKAASKALAKARLRAFDRWKELDIPAQPLTLA